MRERRSAEKVFPPADQPPEREVFRPDDEPPAEEVFPPETVSARQERTWWGIQLSHIVTDARAAARP